MPSVESTPMQEDQWIGLGVVSWALDVTTVPEAGGTTASRDPRSILGQCNDTRDPACPFRPVSCPALSREQARYCRVVMEAAWQEAHGRQRCALPANTVESG
jgi:hypothetical protein